VRSFLPEFNFSTKHLLVTIPAVLLDLVTNHRATERTGCATNRRTFTAPCQGTDARSTCTSD